MGQQFLSSRNTSRLCKATRTGMHIRPPLFGLLSMHASMCDLCMLHNMKVHMCNYMQRSDTCVRICPRCIISYPRADQDVTTHAREHVHVYAASTLRSMCVIRLCVPCTHVVRMLFVRTFLLGENQTVQGPWSVRYMRRGWQASSCTMAGHS